MNRLMRAADTVRVLLASVAYARAERDELLTAHLDAWRARIDSVPLPTFPTPSITKEGTTK